jgi:DNA repair photolyase
LLYNVGAVLNRPAIMAISEKSPYWRHALRRGTELDPKNRFERIAIEVDDYCDPDEERTSPKTELFWDDTQSIVTENHSPDVPFRYSLNPYRGCEHGCAYCYARTYHEYLGWNAGTDFESKILVKSNAAGLLRDWLARPSWNGSDHLMLSGVTDPYQPVERKLRVTRSLLEVCVESIQSVGIISKNAMVTRDIDLLQILAQHSAVNVAMSVTTLDKSLAMILEPRCSIPEAKLRAIRELSNAGIPVHVNMGPIIPGLTEHEIPSVMEAIADAGAKSFSWILLRLPGAVEPIFLRWLDTHVPTQKEKIVGRLRQMRGGELNDGRFGRRMKGDGFASQEWSQLANVMRRKLGLLERPLPLNHEAFRPPRTRTGQMFLF